MCLRKITLRFIPEFPPSGRLREGRQCTTQSLANRWSQQPVQRLRLHIFLPEERFIRSVFQQSPHEIGHPRQQISHRGIKPQPAPLLRDCLLKWLSHAEDHLIFPGLRREPQRLSHGFDVGQRPEIVRPEGRTNQGGLRQDETRERLIVGIGLCLLLKQRNRPAPLPIPNRVRIPVGAFHQSNRDGRPTLPDPSQKPLDILRRLPMVGLQCESCIGIGLVGGLRKEPGEDLEQQRFGFRLFHIEDQRSGESHRQIEERPKPRRDGLVAPFRIDRIEMRREGGDFERELDARDRPEMVPLQGRNRRPRGCRSCKRGQGSQTTITVAIRLTVADRGLAQ